MNLSRQFISIGKNWIQNGKQPVSGEYVKLSDGNEYYKISNYDSMPPFFMSIVSASDHWIFISSTGGLSAGRKSSDNALFPYCTEDKITESHEHTGCCTILKIKRNKRYYLWEPFSDRYAGIYNIQRNLYKSIYGNSIVFEEINNDLGFTFSYSWRTSDKYGIVRSSSILSNERSCNVDLLDGIQNILPYGTISLVQNTFSVLLDAYKRNECDAESGMGIYSLSSILTDKAQPSEALKATTVWQAGLSDVKHLVCSQQITLFRHGYDVIEENDIRDCRGAYFINTSFLIGKNEKKEWHIAAELNMDSCSISSLRNLLIKNQEKLKADLEKDITRGTSMLKEIVSRADGIHLINDKLHTVYHYTNVLFNIMRGGVFVNNYSIESSNLISFAKSRNKKTFTTNKLFFESLPVQINIQDLILQASATDNHDLIRICYEYLPLTFSRRHGDPSRPWNDFSINIHNENGSYKIDYQGNWRDIFQNWEALTYSYPEFIESMIVKFLNATTADGYNPYRITASGIDWEIPETGNPWANIGYWSDHQIIYLQKLLEVSDKFHPGLLSSLLFNEIFCHANVPYKIRTYNEMLDDFYSTIVFDHKLEDIINERVRKVGFDGKLLFDTNGDIFYVSLAEKLLILLLAKVSNFIPEGGIWMNTQRPEWNDANNALVGKGLSMVTVYHLLRYITFCENLFKHFQSSECSITEEVKTWFDSVSSIIEKYINECTSSLTDIDRRNFMDEMGFVSTNYREKLYSSGFTGSRLKLNISHLSKFLSNVKNTLRNTIKINRCEDGLYHSYNILSIEKKSISIKNLYEMLEGQVAVLSSGYLNTNEALKLLDALRCSKMYRDDQKSYLLYPDKELKTFLEKNCFTENVADNSLLIKSLIRAGDGSIVQRDENGNFHFNGSFKNAKDLEIALDIIKSDPSFSSLVDCDRVYILDIFENVFNHNSFTGRSGTFFSYEGLGSIYWHMVSKLLLAIQEIILACDIKMYSEKIIHSLCHTYFEIQKGIGFKKSPDLYGAFPTDPYSHTPRDKGARQPGMTGQVKEQIISRLGEVGIVIKSGAIHVNTVLLNSTEFLEKSALFEYYSIDGCKKNIKLEPGMFAITFCQTPLIFVKSIHQKIVVNYTSSKAIEIDNYIIYPEISKNIFRRDGSIENVFIYTIIN